MKIKYIKITNFRALAETTFEFHPQFTLVVGNNGTGKSTLLDAIRICASRILPSITLSKAKAMSFTPQDIPKDMPFLNIDLGFEINECLFNYSRLEWRETHAKDNQHELEKLKRATFELARPRERLRKLLRNLEESQGVTDRDTYDPDQKTLEEFARKSKVRSNCIFFSPTRSVISEAGVSKARTAGLEAAAYSEALSPRPLYLSQISDWMRAQHELAIERPLSERHLQVLESAIREFLPGFRNFGPGKDGEPQLQIDKKSLTLDVRQLSDGERGVLSLVLDISRRLSQANPKVNDPLKLGEAVILIDEIDLHLHPKWQRTIVESLVKVFPRCQFIATTHSPFVIQSLRFGKLINLDPEESNEYSDKSIEDIAENVMGIELPQKSQRYLKMMTAAEEYFQVLRDEATTPTKLQAAEQRLNDLSAPFSDDPAFQALLTMEKKLQVGAMPNETSR